MPNGAEQKSNGHSTGVSPGALRTFMGIVSSRLGLSSYLGSTYQGARQIEDQLGYKDVLTYRDFKRAYERYDLAQRLVNAYPEDTWAQPPTLKEDDQDDVDTAFEQAWQGLAERLELYNVLMRADIQANLGHYAIILIGLAGQTNLTLPATRVRSPDDILYLQPYSEEFAEIQDWGTDPGQADYARPRTYRINTGINTPDGLRRPHQAQLIVHASRVLHVAGEYRLDDELYGLPYLEVVYNILQDLLKVRGGGAEGFWRDARRRIATLLREGYQLAPEDRAHLEQEVEEYAMGWKDFLRLSGMDVQQLSGQVASPKDHFEMLIACLAGARKIPQRKLIGTEEGRLAGSQDEDAYLREVTRRQLNYGETRLLRRLITLFVDLGALDLPADGYTVDWGNPFALSELQQAEVADKRAGAINKYEAGRVGALNAGLSPTVPLQEFRETVLGLPPESEYALELPAMLPVDEGTQDGDTHRPLEGDGLPV
jgi:uncharacterized protein